MAPIINVGNLTDSLADAKICEHAIEHVIGRDDANQIIECTYRGSQMRRGRGSVHALPPRRAKRLDLVERTLQRQSVARARHHGLRIPQREQPAEGGLR